MFNTEFNIPKHKGKYCLGGEKGFCVFLKKKPSILKRFFMKHLLGWHWYDDK